MMYTLLSYSLSQLAPVRAALHFTRGSARARSFRLRPAGECLLRPFALAGVAMMYTLFVLLFISASPCAWRHFISQGVPLVLGLLGFDQPGNVCYGRSLFLALP